MLLSVTFREVRTIVFLIVIFVLIPILFYKTGRRLQAKSGESVKFKLLKYGLIVGIFTWAILRFFGIVSFKYNVDPFLLGDFSAIFGLYWFDMGLLFLLGAFVGWISHKVNKKQ